MNPLTSTDPSHVGPHRLLSQLGAGGMGQVYLARTAEGRLAAVKVVRRELAEDPGFRARFSREVRTAQMVSGPFTPSVVSADPDAVTPWMATEYVPGPTLSQALAANGPFPEESLRVLALGLAQALQAIHEAGLMHRDLKPGNVLLSPRGPQVIDFGIARAVEGTVLTRTGESFGTPSYASPELVLGREQTPLSDVFSLAGIVVYAAGGVPPFGRGPAPEVLRRVVGAAPDVGNVPPGTLRSLVERCLAKDPEERPTSQEIARILSAEPLPSAEHGWLPSQVTGSISEYEREADHVVRSATDEAGPEAGTDRVGGGARRRGWLIAGSAAAASVALVVGVALTLVDPSSTASEDTGVPDAPSEEPVEQPSGPAFPGDMHDVRFTPDGDGLYVHTQHDFGLWDWREGELLVDHDLVPSSYEVSPAGLVVATYSNILVVWNEEGEAVDIYESDTPDDVFFYDAVSVSGDGSLVSFAEQGTDGVFAHRIWNRESDTIVHEREYDDQIAFTTFGSNDDHLLLGTFDAEPRVLVTETGSGDVITEFPSEAPDEPDHADLLFETAVSPTGPLIAVHQGGGEIVLFDVEADEAVTEIQAPGAVSGLTFTPDGSQLLSENHTGGLAADGGRIWDVATGEEVTSGETLLYTGVTVHPDGETIVSAETDPEEGSTLLFLSPETLRVTHEIS